MAPRRGDDKTRRLRTRWTRLTASEVGFETDTSTPAGSWIPMWSVALKPAGH